MSDRPRVPATEAGQALLNAWYPEDLSLADGEKGGMVEDIIAIEAEAALPSVDALVERIAEWGHNNAVEDEGFADCDSADEWRAEARRMLLAALVQPVPDGQETTCSTHDVPLECPKCHS